MAQRQLRPRMIALDSNVFIYIFEHNETFGDAAETTLKRAHERGDGICLSTLVLTEILSGSDEPRIIDFFQDKAFSFYDVTTEVAALAGSLRFKHPALRTADALHLATALQAGAKQFVTNDRQLCNLRLSLELDVVPLTEFAK